MLVKEHSIKSFFEDNKDDFQMKVMTKGLESKIAITTSDIHRPAFALAGFMENYLHERIQILGETEIMYLKSLVDIERKAAIERLFSEVLCCIIVTKGLDIPGELLLLAEKNTVPVIQTKMQTTEFIHVLTGQLDYVFAPRTVLHGSLVDVYGVGLLFSGRSSIGKSEIALDLVERGHRLVADDVVEVVNHGNVLMGRGRDHLRHFMEIRGLGIINMMDLFGIRAVRIQKRIEVVVRLEDWDPEKDWDRLGLDDHTTDILGVPIRQLVIPIFPGKNITVISEAIALNHMLKVYGIDAAKRLDEQLVNVMESDRKTRRYLKYDNE
ncbi:MAG: HPr(Ser) kinase/phosphatase [Candidatus Krumholzibacteriota bacterium]|nr:HPr(Ser) kinase/phosphatase [Candidatus Krumholzibacteriota bacterium]